MTRPQKRKHLARVLHGTLAQHASQLRQLNDLGAGVYVTINETDLEGRRATNITALRALFVDSDTGNLPALALQPTIKVRSARGEHAYWRLVDAQPLAQFAAAQNHLARALNTDGTVKDLPRVMRLPGFLHRKAIVKAWAKRGWLLQNSGGSLTYRVRIAGTAARVYALRQSAVAGAVFQDAVATSVAKVG